MRRVPVELFEYLLQGGSFAILAVVIVWAILRAYPEERDRTERTLRSLSGSHEQVVRNIIAQHQAELDRMHSDHDRRHQELLEQERDQITAIRELQTRINAMR